jgi:hypothetical protein
MLPEFPEHHSPLSGKKFLTQPPGFALDERVPTVTRKKVTVGARHRLF